jgi:hypothetical protein
VLNRIDWPNLNIFSYAYQYFAPAPSPPSAPGELDNSNGASSSVDGPIDSKPVAGNEDHDMKLASPHNDTPASSELDGQQRADVATALSSAAKIQETAPGKEKDAIDIDTAMTTDSETTPIIISPTKGPTPNRNDLPSSAVKSSPPLSITTSTVEPTPSPFRKLDKSDEVPQPSTTTRIPRLASLERESPRGDYVASPSNPLRSLERAAPETAKVSSIPTSSIGNVNMSPPPIAPSSSTQNGQKFSQFKPPLPAVGAQKSAYATSSSYLPFASTISSLTSLCRLRPQPNKRIRPLQRITNVRFHVLAKLQIDFRCPDSPSCSRTIPTAGEDFAQEKSVRRPSATNCKTW